LYRNKYFLEEIICGKSVKLDREYRERNLMSHSQRGKCGVVSDKQLSTKSFPLELLVVVYVMKKRNYLMKNLKKISFGKDYLKNMMN